MAPRLSAAVSPVAVVLFAVLLTVGSAKLIQSIELARHGARATLGKEFDDSALLKYDVGYGELTQSGMRMHYLIGTEMRKRFTEDIEFLNPVYNATEVYVRSTDVHRTLQSAESQLMGLFPLGSGLLLPNEHTAELAIPPLDVDNVAQKQSELGLFALPQRYEPVPVNTVERDTDYLLTPWSGACPKIGELKDQSRDAPASVKYFETYVKPVLPKVQEITGIDTSDFTTHDASKMFDIFDEFICGLTEGNAMPDGADDQFIKDIYSLAIFNFYYYDWGLDDIVKLGTTELWNTIIDNFTKKVQGKNDNKFTLFLAHDTTITGVLRGLKQDTYYPYFASTIFFNLYEKDADQKNIDEHGFLTNDESDYYVTVTFNDKPLELEGCGGTECNLETFVKFLISRSVPDLDTACQK